MNAKLSSSGDHPVYSDASNLVAVTMDSTEYSQSVYRIQSLFRQVDSDLFVHGNCFKSALVSASVSASTSESVTVSTSDFGE